jgi:hypothetical protein
MKTTWGFGLASIVLSAALSIGCSSEAPAPSEEALDDLNGSQGVDEQCTVEGCGTPTTCSGTLRCSDADGSNKWSTGTLFMMNNGVVVDSRTDYCSSYTYVVEYTCSSLCSWKATTYGCANGCSGGRCL